MFLGFGVDMERCGCGELVWLGGELQGMRRRVESEGTRGDENTALVDRKDVPFSEIEIMLPVG